MPPDHRIRLGLGLAILLASLVTGCVRYTEPVLTEQAPAPETQRRALWEASRDVLRRYGFTLDRQDFRAGVLTTHPMVGKHFFEFWRKDAVSPYDLAESTIQKIYRQVTVRLEPTEAGAGAETYKPLVKVVVSRSDRDRPEVTSTSEAFDLFLIPAGEEPLPGELADRQSAELTGNGGDDIVPLGGQAGLADRLAAEIMAAAEQRVAGQAR